MNDPLLNFVIHFREPATTAEFWAEIALVRGWNKAADLPHTFDDLADELRLLAIAGRVACQDGYWRPVPQVVKAERVIQQKELFA